MAVPESTDPLDQARFVAIAETFRLGRLDVLDYDMHKKTDFEAAVKTMMGEEASKIYFVNVKNCSYQQRHAEEFLCDIAEIAKTLKPGEVYTSIAGKKRPCMGCTGRMTDVVDQFGAYPGNLWVNTIEHQPMQVAARTAHVLLSHKAHITVTRSGKKCQDYDTDSGSDIGF